MNKISLIILILTVIQLLHANPIEKKQAQFNGVLTSSWLQQWGFNS